jgi:hypothetical protein
VLISLHTIADFEEVGYDGNGSKTNNAIRSRNGSRSIPDES